MERLGATVVLVGDAYDEAQAYAKKRAEEEGRTFIPPFDHPDVIMGQGTVGMEIVSQTIGRPIHAIFVPVGGGGLIAGIAAYVKRVKPEVSSWLLIQLQQLAQWYAGCNKYLRHLGRRGSTAMEQFSYCLPFPNFVFVSFANLLHAWIVCFPFLFFEFFLHSLIF